MKDFFLLLTFATLLFGCEMSDRKEAKTTVNAESKPGKVLSAYADLQPTKGNNVKGRVTFTVVKEGVKVVADIENLSPGQHGFHIHEKGDCSAPDASSAGAHFNPSSAKHGGPDDQDRHAGDLGNLVADANGRAHYERIDRMLSLDGPESIVGLSVIVHAAPDDYVTQPTGNSGGRQACGVIKSEK